MKMKTPTPSQWKVTEFKEELNKLKTGCFKDGLTRRLDQVLRSEMDDTTVDEAGNATRNVVSDAPDFVSVAEGYTEDSIENADAKVVPFKHDVASGEITMGNVGEALGVIKENDIRKQVSGDPKLDEQLSGLSNDPVLFHGMVTRTDVAHVAVGDRVSEEQPSGLGNLDASPVVVGNKVSEEQQPGLNVDLVGEAKFTGTDVASVVMCNEVLPSEKAVADDGLVSGKMEIGVQEHSEDVTLAHVDVKLVSSGPNQPDEEPAVNKPPNGGRLLVAEFVDLEEEVTVCFNLPTTVARPPIKCAVVPGPSPLPGQQGHRVQYKLPPRSPPIRDLRRPPTTVARPPIKSAVIPCPSSLPGQGHRMQHNLPPRPPPIRDLRRPSPPPIGNATLDELFRKTKATPRIYYLPLSDEEVAAKQKNPKALGN